MKKLSKSNPNAKNEKTMMSALELQRLEMIGYLTLPMI